MLFFIHYKHKVNKGGRPRVSVHYWDGFLFLILEGGGEGEGGREQCFVAWSWGGGDLKNHFYCSKIKHPCFSIWVMKLNFVSFIFCFSPTYFLEQIPDGRSKCQSKNEDKCQIWGDD